MHTQVRSSVKSYGRFEGSNAHSRFDVPHEIRTVHHTGGLLSRCIGQDRSCRWSVPFDGQYADFAQRSRGMPLTLTLTEVVWHRLDSRRMLCPYGLSVRKSYFFHLRSGR